MSCSFACPCLFRSQGEALFFSILFLSPPSLSFAYRTQSFIVFFRFRCLRLQNGQPSQHLEYKRRNISIIMLVIPFNSKLQLLRKLSFQKYSLYVSNARTKCTCIYMYMLQPICKISRFMKWLIFLAFS